MGFCFLFLRKTNISNIVSQLFGKCKTALLSWGNQKKKKKSHIISRLRIWTFALNLIIERCWHHLWASNSTTTVKITIKADSELDAHQLLGMLGDHYHSMSDPVQCDSSYQVIFQRCFAAPFLSQSKANTTPSRNVAFWSFTFYFCLCKKKKTDCPPGRVWCCGSSERTWLPLAKNSPRIPCVSSDVTRHS